MITDHDEPNPFIEIFELLRDGRKKERALKIANMFFYLATKSESDRELKVSLSSILSSVFLWNGDYAKAETSHHIFLNDSNWYLKNPDGVEPYLVMVYAQNNEGFINALLVEHPKLKTDFSDLFNAHQCLLNPDSEDHFNIEYLPSINRINAAKRLYFLES